MKLLNCLMATKLSISGHTPLQCIIYCVVVLHYIALALQLHFLYDTTSDVCCLPFILFPQNIQ